MILGDPIIFGGSGGLSPNSAVIHVTALAGSTISFEKGGVVAKLLGPGESHVNSADSSFADWYYAVSPGNYGEWTVTGTNSEGSISQTITVNEVKQYNVILYFGRLYWEGNEYAGVTGGWGATQATGGYGYVEAKITKNDDNILAQSNGGNGSEGCIGTLNKIDLTRYNTLKINVISAYGSGYAGNPEFFASPDNIGQVTRSAVKRVGSSGVTSIDISSLSGEYYILIVLPADANRGSGVTFDKIWLEA